MAVNEQQVQFIQDQLTDFGEVDVKKMFGGAGFYKDGTMFGMLAGETFRMRVDEQNQNDYEKAGMSQYFNKGKKKGMPYWEVPADVLEDRSALKTWAQKAFDAAQRNSKS